jgi:hypothetical protein
MAYYRYMVGRKLRGSDTSEYRYRAPICQVCGHRLTRVALRENLAPWAWLPYGWMCTDCAIIDLDLFQ